LGSAKLSDAVNAAPSPAHSSSNSADSQRGECRTTSFCFGDTNRWPLAQETAIRFPTLFRHEAVIDYAWDGEQVLLEKSKKHDCIKAFSETDFRKISKSLTCRPSFFQKIGPSFIRTLPSRSTDTTGQVPPGDRTHIDVAIQQAHGPIDVLVNNAGIEPSGSVEELPLSDFRAVMETNYFGVIRCIQSVAPQMRQRRSVYSFQPFGFAHILPA
jgi:hypothetical protein